MVSSQTCYPYWSCSWLKYQTETGYTDKLPWLKYQTETGYTDKLPSLKYQTETGYTDKLLVVKISNGDWLHWQAARG